MIAIDLLQRYTSNAGLFAVLTTVLMLPSGQLFAERDELRMWPRQMTPAGLITVPSIHFAEPEDNRLPINDGDDHFLAQSLAGLAAQAVNKGRGDELVYIDLWNNTSYHKWRRMLLERTGIEDRGETTVWQLVDRYHKQGNIHGYVLYRMSERSADAENPSVNVATSVAGILGGILISERQEAEAQRLGLPLLLDARDKTEAWCFETYREKLNPKLLLLQRHHIPNNRAIAIAHRVLTIRGDYSLAEQVYQWMEPPGLVFGWNGVQGEGEGVRQISRWGHTLVPSDWAVNLPALSVGAQDLKWPPFERPQPSLDAEPGSGAGLSFILTDGDNLQWILGNFAWNDHFWSAPALQRLPFGFGLPVTEIMEVAPDAYLHFQKTKPEQTSIIVAPGYFFPDHLGIELPAEKRRELLTFYGRRIEVALRQSNLNSIILICENLNAPRTEEAWAILSDAAPSLEVGFVMQYDPYEASEGRVWRVERTDGSQVPFVSAAWSLWSQANRPRAGGPAALATLLDRDEPSDLVPAKWVAVHAWSNFRESLTNEHRQGPIAGVDAAVWCMKRITSDWHIVSPTAIPALFPDSPASHEQPITSAVDSAGGDAR